MIQITKENQRIIAYILLVISVILTIVIYLTPTEYCIRSDILNITQCTTNESEYNLWAKDGFINKDNLK